jgi:hypothetical protein
MRFGLAFLKSYYYHKKLKRAWRLMPAAKAMPRTPFFKAPMLAPSLAACRAFLALLRLLRLLRLERPDRPLPPLPALRASAKKKRKKRWRGRGKANQHSATTL